MGNLNIPKSYRKSVKLIGPILELRPDQLREKEDLRDELGLPKDKLVIFVPISGSTKEKAFLTGLLRRILLEFPDDYEIVMSLGYPDDKSKPIRYGNVTICKWIPNRFEYLKACDLVIARAGHGTITQAMCYGKPIILIPTPGHTEQIINAKQALDLGIAKILLQKEVTRERLLKTVLQVVESEMSEKLGEIQKDVLVHDGLQNAVDIIRETALKNG